MRVLMFHRVLPKSLINDHDAYYLRGTLVSTEFLESVIEAYLRKKFVFKTLTKAIDASNENTIVLTFDDGYEDNFKFVFPILNKYKINATFYPTIGYCIGNSIAPLDFYYYFVNKYVFEKEKADWITGKVKSDFINLKIEDQQEYIKDLFKRELPIVDLRYMNSEELKILSKAGNEIGGHTLYHDLYTNLVRNEFHYDYYSMKKHFSALSIFAETFAYSDGRYNESIYKLLANDGLKGACTIKANIDSVNPNFKIEREFSKQ